MTPDLLLSALFVVILVAVLLVSRWLLNATVSFTWAAKTSHPEPKDQHISFSQAEIDEALADFMKKRYAEGERVERE